MKRSVPDNVRTRIARPRGGRRPPPAARPADAQNAPLAQSFPAPSWGNTNAANSQQPSGGFTFGQQAGGDNNSIFSQSASFPPFGAQPAQQPAAPSTTGFNFSAPSNGPQMNNPFAASSLNHSSTHQAAPNGFSGSIFNIPQSTTAQSNNVQASSALNWKTPPPNSMTDWKTPSHTADKNSLADIYQEKDPQSFFVAHAPFKWGQTDPPKQELSQQTFNESAANNAAQQNTQSSTNIFGFNEPPKQMSSSIFANSQQQTPSPSPFGQQSAPQSQPTNMFGQASDSPSQAQSSQTLSNIFGQANTTSTSGVGNFAKSAMSPAKNGDAMSTTPDTSPQTGRDSDRYGAFASALTKPAPGFGHGGTPSASANNIFGFPSNSSQNQQSSTSMNGEGGDNSRDTTSEPSSGPKPSDISLGSPTKNQKPTQPNFGQSQMGQAKVPENRHSADFGWSAAPATNTTASANSPSKAPLAVSETNGDSSSKAAESANQTDATKAMALIRESGIPPPPPGQFTEEQSRQLITGYRLRQLDQGLQSYLEYSSWGDDEVESISTYYQLQKRAILLANGGPVKKVMNRKRAADTDESSTNKKARRQAPKAPTGQSDSLPAEISSGQNNLSKRKADEEMSKDTPQTNGFKKSKANDQVTYPSLPESSSSQTSKLFGNLIGKTTQQSSSITGDSPFSGHLPNGASSNDGQSSEKAARSGSSLFFPLPKSDSAERQKTPAQDSPQAALSNSSAQVNSTPLQSKSNGIFDQPSNPDGQSPFKGFFSSKPSSSSTNLPPSNSRLAAPSLFQSADTSSPFKFLNSGPVDPKPISNNSGQRSDAKQSSHNAVFDDQRAKAANADRGPSSTPRTTTERIGFGESIFSRPSAKPSNTSNIFGHLASSPSGEGEDDENEGEDTEETSNGTNPTVTSSTGNAASTADKKNDSTASVFNPFASASFKPATSPSPNPFANATVPPNLKPIDADQTSGGRSLFDRIEKADKGAPGKDGNKPADLGQNIPKTPTTAQGPGTGFGGFGVASNNMSASTSPSFGLFGQSSTPPPGASTSSNSPSGDNTWKAGTPLKFASSTGAPSFNLTAPSPAKTPLTGLFGAPKASTTSENPSSPAKPAPLTFGISAPPKDSSASLAPPSGTQSESTSRATSPGAPSSENGNEASDEVHEAQTHPELDAAEANKAEADEDTIFEAMAKVHELAPQKTRNPQTGKEEHSHKWITRGHEQLRVLRNRETKKTRLLMKLKVNGRVILNAGLQQSLTYNLATPKQVRVPVPADGKITTWHIQVGKETAAQELVSVLEANKAN
ncbi:MAG: hypothetical protein Q9183_000898 [Haloplaca sp. 2 TL-2023]